MEGMRQKTDFTKMVGHGAVSTRLAGTTGDGVRASNKEQSPLRSKDRADRTESISGPRPFAPIDINQQRATSTLPSASKGNTKHDNPSGTQTSEDPNAPVTIEEVRKGTNGAVTIHRYLRGKLLGKGGFAKVYLCTSLDTNKNYAIKIVPKANLVKARARQKLQAEIKIHRTLKHHNICEFKHFFEDRMNCYILLELCELQSMNELLRRRKRLTEPEVIYFMLQLIEGTLYMHSHNVIHRDLKLGNLFLNRNLEIKIGDLGLATKLTSAEDRRTTICGTPNYIAPEIIDGKKGGNGHSFEVDIWSMGVILYTLVVGRPPYESKDVKATYQRILNNEYSFPEHISVSEYARDLIGAMLQREPSSRPSLADVRNHAFFTCNDGKIPKSLPTTCAFLEPVWQEGNDGQLVAVFEDETRSNLSQKKRPDLALHTLHDPDSRRPLSSRDQNHVGSTVKEKASVSSALSAKSSTAGGHVRTTAIPESYRKKAVAFEVFDENREIEANGQSSDDRKAIVESIVAKASISSVGDKNAPFPPMHDKETIMGSVNAVMVGTAALSIGDEHYRGKVDSTETLGIASVSGATAKPKLPQLPSTDTVALQLMHTRLSDFLDNGVISETSSSSVDGWAGGGGTIGVWVARYVDYTSKYGLGFLLNNGSSGVYFNDSTKAVIAPEGDIFNYIERRKNVSADPRMPEYDVHTLSSFPDSLKKKVTLLKHFCGYLLEQQKHSNEDIEKQTSVETSVKCGNRDLVYLKKWVRSKHAIFFRLSDGTVQVIFFDQTELLLSSDISNLTYVDKSRSRRSMQLNMDVMASHPDITKRLKYTRDILYQLVHGVKAEHTTVECK